MKKLLSLLLVAAFALFLGACSTTSGSKAPGTTAASVEKSLPYLRTSSTLAVTGVLISIKPEGRSLLAKKLYGVALGLRTFTGTGVAATPAQLKNVIVTFGGTDPQFQSLAVSLVNLYTGIFPKLQGNAALASEVFEQVAEGVEDAAAGYL